MIICPYCKAPNADSATSCAGCSRLLLGKGQRTSSSTGPASGQSLPPGAADNPFLARHYRQTDEKLRARASRTFYALLAIAVLNVGCGFLVYFSADIDDHFAMGGLIISQVVGAAFGGLAAWSRVKPVHASLAALILFVISIPFVPMGMFLSLFRIAAVIVGLSYCFISAVDLARFRARHS